MRLALVLTFLSSAVLAAPEGEQYCIDADLSPSLVAGTVMISESSGAVAGSIEYPSPTIALIGLYGAPQFGHRVVTSGSQTDFITLTDQQLTLSCYDSKPMRDDALAELLEAQRIEEAEAKARQETLQRQELQAQIDADGALYIPLRLENGKPMFVVALNSNDGTIHYLQAYLEAKVRDVESYFAIHDHMPLLVAKLNAVLSAQAYETLLTPAGTKALQPQANAVVSQTLLERTPQAVAAEVVFTNLVMQ